MPQAAEPRPATVAMVGNPNTGKTTLFNALTGAGRHVANYAGVTVDVASGRVRHAGRPLTLVDLPGACSLTPASPDEAVLWDALVGQDSRHSVPDVVLGVVDATNLPRGLYLVSQLLEMGRPVVVALTMVDVARRHGLRVDTGVLSRQLGVPVLPAEPDKPENLRAVVAAIEGSVGTGAPSPQATLPPGLWAAASRLAGTGSKPMSPGAALRALVDRGGHGEASFIAAGGDRRSLEAASAELSAILPDAAAAEIRARFGWARDLTVQVVEKLGGARRAWSDRLDAVLTNRLVGTGVLLVIIYLFFAAIYAGAAPLMSGIDYVFRGLGMAITRALGQGAIQSLLTDGLLAGVGTVISFLPQILILFFFIAVLEDCGYLPRAAFMVDRLMRPLGLSGRAFIPLLSSFACAVPAIMGSRAIAGQRERMITILIAPFLSCAGRLPIYVLLVGACVPAKTWLGGWIRLDALTIAGLYLLGVLVAIPVAYVLRHMLPSRCPEGFVLELPPYHWPRMRTIWPRVMGAGRSFLMRAGTTILVANAVIWAMGYFPRSESTVRGMEAERVVRHWDESAYSAALAGAQLQDSLLGRLGQVIEPAIRPLGWDWRIGVSVLSSFPARETVIATLGTMANLGDGASGTGSFREAILAMKWPTTGQPLLTLPVALSIMVFFALCAQCLATLVVMRHETGSWAWPAASFVGMTVLAYGGAWMTGAVARACGL